jgi:uncharacterized membrane protein (DUF2068 family)
MGENRHRMLTLIALFKFAKATLLTAAGLGAFELLNPEAAEHARHWVTAVAWRVDRRHAAAIEASLSRLTHSRLEVFGLIAFCWAALFVVEGIGLWKVKRWAEYLTLIATASFLPLEGYELIRHVTWPRVLALGANLVVVGYLLWLKRKREF